MGGRFRVSAVPVAVASLAVVIAVVLVPVIGSDVVIDPDPTIPPASTAVATTGAVTSDATFATAASSTTTTEAPDVAAAAAVDPTIPTTWAPAEPVPETIVVVTPGVGEGYVVLDAETVNAHERALRLHGLGWRNIGAAQGRLEHWWGNNVDDFYNPPPWPPEMLQDIANLIVWIPALLDFTETRLAEASRATTGHPVADMLLREKWEDALADTRRQADVGDWSWSLSTGQQRDLPPASETPWELCYATNCLL